MTARRPGNAPRHTVALYVAVAAVSATALVAMGARLLSQERALERRRLDERRETATDRAVAGLEAVLQTEERRLTTPGRVNLRPADDALLVVLSSAGVDIQPETSVLFHPVLPSSPTAPAGLYSRAERLEFVERDPERAIAALRPLAGSRDPAVRAGAQMRLARNLRKAGRLDAALAAYHDLASVPQASLSGVPAGVVAASARCLLLEELGRQDELRQEAGSLRDGLASGRWLLDRDAYLYYSAQVERWLHDGAPADAGRLALSEAVHWLWHDLRPDRGLAPDAAGRRALRFHDAAVTILWRASAERVTALVAGPRYQRRRWFDPVAAAPDLALVRMTARDRGSGAVYGDPPPAGVPTSLRPASATTLPWDLLVATRDLDDAMSGFAQRRRVMILGLSLVVLFVLAASYVAGRAAARETAAARLQSDFVSAVSHEFRTPLTSMRQFTEMLVEGGDLCEEDRRTFHRAQERATRRLSRLVESLLDFGRMEAGARPYRREPLDAGGLVRTVVEEFRQEGGGDGRTIECTLPDAATPVDGDREALAQALWNLLDNAVKYSGGSRAVAVDVEDGTRVRIRVRDRGPGIAPAERRRIFEKFARGSSAAATGVKGTGLGLAMVRHIVAAHGGRVTLESPPEGGSVFTIELPRGRMDRCRES